MARDSLLAPLKSDKTMLSRLAPVPKVRRTRPVLSPLEVDVAREEKLEEEDEAGQIRRQIGDHPGDEKVARAIVNLKKTWPRGTVPELLTYNWLEANSYDFSYQAAAFGGRLSGGMMPDFIIKVGGKGLAWLVQGSYYHSVHFQRAHAQDDRDIVAELRLKGQYVGGVRIESVVSLFEEDIYDRRPDVFNLALGGQNL